MALIRPRRLLEAAPRSVSRWPAAMAADHHRSEIELGAGVGAIDGVADGPGLGTAVGADVGEGDVGTADGAGDGTPDGAGEGVDDGRLVGSFVSVGADVGRGVGRKTGADVGNGVAEERPASRSSWAATADSEARHMVDGSGGPGLRRRGSETRSRAEAEVVEAVEET